MAWIKSRKPQNQVSDHITCQFPSMGFRSLIPKLAKDRRRRWMKKKGSFQFIVHFTPLSVFTLCFPSPPRHPGMTEYALIKTPGAQGQNNKAGTRGEKIQSYIYSYHHSFVCVATTRNGYWLLATYKSSIDFNAPLFKTNPQLPIFPAPGEARMQPHA